MAKGFSLLPKNINTDMEKVISVMQIGDTSIFTLQVGQESLLTTRDLLITLRDELTNMLGDAPVAQRIEQ